MRSLVKTIYYLSNRLSVYGGVLEPGIEVLEAPGVQGLASGDDTEPLRDELHLVSEGPPGLDELVEEPLCVARAP